MRMLFGKPTAQMKRSVLILAGCCIATAIPRNASFALELPYRNEATRQLLIQSLREEDRVPRVRAASDLAGADADRNREVLSGLASDPIETVRRAALSPPCPPTEGKSPVLSPPVQLGAGSQSLESLAAKSGFTPRPKVEESLITETHRDPRIRQIARLRKLESDPACREDFTKLLDDPDYFVRRAVTTQVVKKRGSSSLSIWRNLLASDRLNDQVEAAWAVGQLDSKTDEPTLLKLLDSNSERLRLINVESLERIGGDATRQALGEAILKHTAKTQEALLQLAARLQARPALPVIRNLAADKKAALNSRLLAIDAIRAMSDGEAKDILMKIITSYGYENSDVLLREHAARALGVVGGPDTVAPLRKLVTDKVLSLPMVGPAYDSDFNRIACIESLQQLKATDALKTMLNEAFLKEAGESLRRALAESLTTVTGIAHDYQRSVSFHPHFIESLDPEEYPPAVAENLRKPPVFPGHSAGLMEK